jgi:hypothetical protein
MAGSFTRLYKKFRLRGKMDEKKRSFYRKRTKCAKR